jgi:intein/homing endonuclease
MPYPKVKSMPRKYYCPRCHNENIIEYYTSIDCPKCRKKKKKKDLERFKDDEILAIEEKAEIAKILLEDED